MPEFNDPSVPPFPKTNAEQPAQRRPKFRSACDACGSAKVRCDKSKPKCVRCMTRGIPCNYSISRR
ncbi:transcription activator, partial [Diaporthe sp. PMI_573]